MNFLDSKFVECIGYICHVEGGQPWHAFGVLGLVVTYLVMFICYG